MIGMQRERRVEHLYDFRVLLFAEQHVEEIRGVTQFGFRLQHFAAVARGVVVGDDQRHHRRSSECSFRDSLPATSFGLRIA